jgi:hypothetical protein
MIKVFIGGSRRINRLNDEIKKRLDAIVKKHFHVLVGDANGADKQVQQYLFDCNYDNVEVFCMEGHCRNNIGGWKIRSVSSVESKKSFQYYVIKDEQMTEEATYGFMLWEGKSIGTLANIHRLLSQQKKVLVYLMPQKKFVTLTDADDKKLPLSSLLHRPKQLYLIET